MKTHEKIVCVSVWVCVCAWRAVPSGIIEGKSKASKHAHKQRCVEEEEKKKQRYKAC